MRVHDLVESKEYFIGEIKPNYHVIYEKIESNRAEFIGEQVQMTKLGTEEIVQILQGEGTLLNVGSYRIGSEYPSVDAVLAEVKERHKEIFI